MSALWLRLITFLSLACTALSGPVSSGPVWKDIGGFITIQCTTTLQDQDALSLQRGLGEEEQILYFDKGSEKFTMKKELKPRVETKVQFPKMDIVIKNLTVEDTGAYWCVYKDVQMTGTKGTGSVLLVVQDAAQQKKNCDEKESPLSNTLVLVCVLITGLVLVCVFVVFFIWIFLKIKALRTTTKPRQATTNDVYEDMRATLRR
ncbi:T-cell immunoreceptor with Ig and ITIM domains [Centroberyx affinis]|uniref:T-cell immunoreceptor with Ig and ITIM domains n=1 Tax=Centroberyx affinis TaxID=166261 RepID=UPI003A5C2FF5